VRTKGFLAAALAALLSVGALAMLAVGSSGATPNVAQQTSFRAALISDVGKFNDKSFNQSQLAGLRRAQRAFNISVLPIQSNSSSDYTPNLVRAVQQRSNIIIAAGFLMSDSLEAVADQFPNSRFAITDQAVQAFKKPHANIAGITFATQENSYLIGCMAAMVTALQKRPHVIGVVGGIKIPPVDVFLAGYRAGAQKCVRGTRVLIGYSQDFVKQDLCKAVALNQLQQRAQVIFGVAGQCGLGALSAAREAGRWAIGVDLDQSFLGTHILTSAVKRVDLGVYNTIRAVRNRTFRGGRNLVFNLKNNGVALGKISPRLNRTIKAKVLARVATLRKQIISGKIKPPTVVR
jgi:basic membrane protein A and related proteins